MLAVYTLAIAMGCVIGWLIVLSVLLGRCQRESPELKSVISGRQQDVPSERTESRLGDIVCVEFEDHVENSNTIARCRVFGRLVRHDEQIVLVDNWECIGFGGTAAARDHNTGCYAIVASAITDIRTIEAADAP